MLCISFGITSSRETRDVHRSQGPDVGFHSEGTECYLEPRCSYLTVVLIFKRITFDKIYMVDMQIKPLRVKTMLFGDICWLHPHAFIEVSYRM